MRTQPFSATTLLAGFALALASCADRAPEPKVVATAPPVVEAQASPAAAAKLRPRRTEAGCRAAQADLPVDRKVELFRQFAAEQGGGEQVDADALSLSPRPDPCRQAAR